MTESTLSATSITLRGDFKKKLNEWRRKATCGRHYINPGQLREWMATVESGHKFDNATRLFNEVYSEMANKGDYGPRPRSHRILAGDEGSLIVFSILLDLGYGHLVEIFHNADIYDTRIEFADNYLETHLRERLDRTKISLAQSSSGESKDESIDRVIQDFKQARWSFYPARLKFKMPSTLHDRDWILPFSERRRVNDKGGTANVWQVRLREDDVPSDMRMAISDSKHEHDQWGTVRIDCRSGSKLTVRSILTRNSATSWR